MLASSFCNVGGDGSGFSAPVSSSGAESIVIPKIIHFIWAGGKKPMPDKDLAVIVEWYRRNQSWKIYFWLDGRDDEFAQRLREYYSVKFECLSKDKLLITFCYIQDLSSDPWERHLLPCVFYEIDKEFPNFGASSDILRYLILYRYGGAYFDTDVSPGKNSLEELPQGALERHVLYIEHLGQMRSPSPEQLSEFLLNHLGNDTFISTKNNPLVLKIIESIVEVYCCKRQMPNLDDQVMRVFSSRNIRDITIGTTGPVAVKKLIERERKEFLPSTEEWLIDDVILRRVRRRAGDECVAFTAPQPNTTNWLRAVQNRVFTEQGAMTAIRMIADFEVNHFKVFRFEDYVDIILTVPYEGEAEEKIKNAIQKVYEVFRNHMVELKRQIGFVQITGKYNQCDKLFYFGCQTFFTLKRECFDLAFKFCAFIDRLETMLSMIEQNDISKAQARVNEGMSEILRIDYVAMIDRSIDVTIRVFGNIDRIKCFTEDELCKGLIDHIDRLVKFAEYLDGVPGTIRGAQPKVDIGKLAHIKEVRAKCLSQIPRPTTCSVS